MSDVEKLIRLIESHLKDDILSFEWLLELARHVDPGNSDAERIDLLSATLSEFVNRPDIIFGEAGVEQTVVRWPESGASLGKRLRTTINLVGIPRDSEDCFAFWLGLKAYESKKKISEG